MTLDKGRAIEGFVVVKGWDLEFMDLQNWPQVVVNRPLRYDSYANLYILPYYYK